PPAARAPRRAAAPRRGAARAPRRTGASAPLRRVVMVTAAPGGKLDRVRERRRQEALHPEAHGLGAARQRHDDTAPDHPGRRAREDRARPYLVPREPAERLAEAVERLLEERREHLHGPVTRGDARAAREHQRV